MQWVAEVLGSDAYVNVMGSTIRGLVQAGEYPEIGRRVMKEEMAGALSAAREAGLDRIDGKPARGEGL